MDAIILSWRLQNIATIMVMVLVLMFIGTVLGVGWSRWNMLGDE